VHQALELRVTAATVECLHKGQRVASHVRSALKGRHTTVAAHMPPAHQHQAEWTPQRLERWAAKIGPGTAQAVAAILASRPHPEQGFRAALGVLRLEKSYGAERLEAACQRAVALRACRYKSIASMLDKGLDRVPAAAATTATLLPADHDNLRGPGYYH
jgi:transposase